jgi:hypothetical protein
MKRLTALLLIFITVFIVTSCESETEKLKKEIVGVWDVRTPFVKKRITLNKDGLFEIDVKITEENSEVVVNTGNINGKWDLKEKFFTLSFSHIDKRIKDDIDWKKDKEVLYTFDKVSLKKIIFSTKSINIVWKRFKNPITNKEFINKDITIDLKPIVVNLYKDRIRGKERFLCLHYKLCFEDVEGIDYVIKTKKGEFAKTYYELHPRIRDAVIMFLSSLKFRDIKTFAKSNLMNKDLKKVLNHYLNKKLKTLEIERIVVASSKEGVNDFLGFDDEDTKDNETN